MANKTAIYNIPSARMQADNSSEIVVLPASPAWLSSVGLGLIFGLLGLFWLFSGSSSAILGFFGIGLGLFFLALYPISMSLRIEPVSRRLSFDARYLLRFPQHVEVDAPLNQVASLGYRPARIGKSSVVDLVLLDGSKISMDFGRRAADAEVLIREVKSLAGGDTALLNQPEAIHRASVNETHAQMRRELRSWSIWLLIIGVAQMFQAQGFSSWGVLLILVGLASFYFTEAPMFVVYAVTVGWAGVANLMYGDATWKLFALFQAYLVILLLRQFKRFHSAQQELSSGAEMVVGFDTDAPSVRPAARSARIFPGLSLGLGLLAFLGFAIVLFGVGTVVLMGEVPEWMGTVAILENIAVYAGILALACGLASWLAGHKPRWFAMTGTITGALALLVELGFGLIGLLS